MDALLGLAFTACTSPLVVSLREPLSFSVFIDFSVFIGVVYDVDNTNRILVVDGYFTLVWYAEYLCAILCGSWGSVDK